MSGLGTYSFLPWLRHGLANQILTPDFDTNARVRAGIDVQLGLAGDKPEGGAIAPVEVHHQMALYGPGDIVGIDRRVVVRTEPRDWTTNFEPNYLAAIEFYDEDYPWRYTPAAADAVRGRLRPWLALIVLREDEFTEGRRLGNTPLDYVDIEDLAALPRADELWAWAHVHVNRDLTAAADEIVSTDTEAIQARLTALLKQNADLAYSRIVSPRRLTENTAYHAFLMPTFETGRQAGLGITLTDVAATMSAWDPSPRPQGKSFPYYYRWYFRSGAKGDFEELVRLLKPMPVDARVGVREMDVLHPGSGVAGIETPELGGVLKLGGALRPPAKVPAEPPDAYETWDEPFPVKLQTDLMGRINLADDYLVAGDPDPTVVPPLYGGWHALTKRLSATPAVSTAPGEDPLDWVHRLNLDPRFRVAAGFGTRVIQDQQERFMDAAWEQVGKILEAQRRIRFGQMAKLTSAVWFEQHIMPQFNVSAQQALRMIAPLNTRILTEDSTTLFHRYEQSLLQPVLTSAPLRRIVRPRGRLIRALPFDAAHRADKLLERVGSGEVAATPPKAVPPGLFTDTQAGAALTPPGVPKWIVWLIGAIPWLSWLMLTMASALILLLGSLLPFGIAVPIAATIIAIFLWLLWLLKKWAPGVAAAAAVDGSKQTPGAVDAMPAAPGFGIGEPGSSYQPGTGVDSEDARRFKAALRDTYELIGVSAAAGATPKRNKIDVVGIAAAALKKIDPMVTIPARIRYGMFLPPRVIAEQGDDFVEPMAYPVIDVPMYKPLTDRSPELFLPNINLIANNSITLLETNQRFIESYMVGLNHEFARELLWREFPTDQRGSSFRQFWDVDGVLNTAPLSAEALKEKLRDIKPLHRWSRTGKLGSHDNREAAGDEEEEMVLVIRGELLKRYPSAVIYAHRACWQRHDDGTAADRALDPWLRHGPIDKTKERRLAPLAAAQENSPPPEIVKTPLYSAKVDPDIYFLGFDLGVEEAKGKTQVGGEDDPGWFFVIKERPGEPRFGLDNNKQPRLNSWSDLSWQDVQPGAAANTLELASAPAAIALVKPGAADDENASQYADDVKVGWSRDAMSSAELAYILFQAPVLVGVHASEMLPR